MKENSKKMYFESDNHLSGIRYTRRIIAFIMLTIITGGFFMGCKTMSSKISPIQDFDVNRYLGEWYEVARFDFLFEKNLIYVKAKYFMNQNETICVENSGYDYVAKKFRTKVGKIKFAGNKNESKLKVSFFGPFYDEYNIIALDSGYNYALVAGSTTNLLWILSRTPTIPDEVKSNYLEIAKNLGFKVEKLIWTEQ